MAKPFVKGIGAEGNLNVVPRGISNSGKDHWSVACGMYGVKSGFHQVWFAILCLIGSLASHCYLSCGLFFFFEGKLFTLCFPSQYDQGSLTEIFWSPSGLRTSAAVEIWVQSFADPNFCLGICENVLLRCE